MCWKSTKDLYKIYGELSNLIHGAPWSGPSLKIFPKNMTNDALELVRCLANDLDLEISEGSIPPVIDS